MRQLARSRAKAVGRWLPLVSDTGLRTSGVTVKRLRNKEGPAESQSMRLPADGSCISVRTGRTCRPIGKRTLNDADPRRQNANAGFATAPLRALRNGTARRGDGLDAHLAQPPAVEASWLHGCTTEHNFPALHIDTVESSSILACRS